MQCNTLEQWNAIPKCFVELSTLWGLYLKLVGHTGGRYRQARACRDTTRGPNNPQEPACHLGS